MRKFVLLLFVLLLAISLFALVSCNGIDQSKDKTTHVHTFGEWLTILEAECEKDGLSQRYCSVCKYTESQPIAMMGHAAVVDATVAPTCTKPGLTEGKHCSVCEETLVAQETVAALGHTAGNVATCTTAQTCTVCDSEIVAALGHTAGDAATCTTAQVCTICDAEIVAALGHTEVVDAAVEPTCTETGLTEGKHCSVCEKIFVAQQPVAALGHTAGAVANCTNAQVCTSCDVQLAAALGHTYNDENTCIVCQDYADKGVKFVFLNGEYVVFDYTGNATEIIIPSTYMGYPVTRIGNEAFRGCSSLSITIPDSVTSIGEYAFYIAYRLESIIIPDSVTSIGDDAFDGCPNLIYNEYDNAYYLGNEQNPYVVLIKAKNTDITSCNIHEDTTIVYRDAFEKCCGLTSIRIPDSVWSIGERAFSGCSKLETVIIGNGVTSVGDYAFYGCESLVFNEYDNAYYLGNEQNLYLVLVKAKNISITSFNIYEHAKIIYSDAFYRCSGLTSIIIPDSVTDIGERAFAACSNLVSITIGNSVTGIGNRAFASCSDLTSIIIPDSVTNIGERAFEFCSSLASITIGRGVTDIREGAFTSCYNLASVIIFDSVRSIDNEAFRHCVSLASVNYNGSKAQWNDISKGWSWDANDSDAKFTVYCSDGSLQFGGYNYPEY